MRKSRTGRQHQHFCGCNTYQGSCKSSPEYKNLIQNQVLYYEEQLKKEINQDRSNHNRKSIKDKDEDDDSGGVTGLAEKTVTQSTTDQSLAYSKKKT